MLCPPAVNDNGCAGCAPAIVLPVRAPEDLAAKVLRLLAEAQRADLDGLAFILAMAAREANRVAIGQSGGMPARVGCWSPRASAGTLRLGSEAPSGQ
jgi:hypothetical protein